MSNEVIFSEFEVDRLGLKFSGESIYQIMTCIGTVEEEMTSKNIVKKCRGITVKRITKGTGEGTVKVSAHVPTAIYETAYGMKLENLVSGVKAYGQNSVHKPFGAVMHVTDEDGNEKYKAYPNCIITSGITRKIENGAEEVTQIDLELAVMPDENGNGLYEALGKDITEVLAEAWMTSFDPSLVADVTSYAITQNLTNVTSSNPDENIASGATYNTNLFAGEGYELPTTVTVTVGGTELSAGTDYLYSSTTGALVVVNVTGALVITAEGTPAA